MRSGLPMAFCAHADATSTQGQLAPCASIESERELVVTHLLQLIDERSHDSSEANRLTGCVDDGCLRAGCSHSPTVRGTHRLCTEAHDSARRPPWLGFVTILPDQGAVTCAVGHAIVKTARRSDRRSADAIRDAVALLRTTPGRRTRSPTAPN